MGATQRTYKWVEEEWDILGMKLREFVSGHKAQPHATRLWLELGILRKIKVIRVGTSTTGKVKGSCLGINQTKIEPFESSAKFGNYAVLIELMAQSFSQASRKGTLKLFFYDIVLPPLTNSFPASLLQCRP